MTYPIDKFPHRPAGMALPFEAEGTFIDGLRVLFDERVELAPVDLVADAEDSGVSTIPSPHDLKQESFRGR